MKRSQKTRDALIGAARKLFWSQGYSNVSVRDITRVAGVDAALVSRYFEGKFGLFEASLTGAFDWPELCVEGADLLAVMVDKAAKGLHEAEETSAMKMIIMNSADPHVGALVRAHVAQFFTEPTTKMLGGENAASRMAMVTAVLIGASIVRYDIRAQGLAAADEDGYHQMLEHLVRAASEFKA